MTLASARRGRALASVNLTAHKRDGALTDRRGIPCLDGCKIGVARWYPAPARQPWALRKFAVEFSALAATSRLPVP
jgi:hypothetical protein